MTASILLAELESLAKQAGANLYRRVSLAARLGGDAAWVAAAHAGSVTAARDDLERRFFPDVAVTLGTLLEILRYVPDETDWAKEHYRVYRLQTLAERRRKERMRGAASPKRTPREEEEGGESRSGSRKEEGQARSCPPAPTAADLPELETGNWLEEIDKLKREVADLRERNRALALENARLKKQRGRVSA